MPCLLLMMQPKLGLVPGTESASINDDRITCRFQRLRSVAQQRRSSRQTSATDVVFSLDDARYYLLMAKGHASGG